MDDAFPGGLGEGSLERHPLWLEAGGSTIAAWLHVPRAAVARSHGVLICPPFGFEYAHGHRTLVHLADQLAEHGFAALRIDYPGSGDSSGREGPTSLVEPWIQAICAGLDTLESLTGGVPSVVGVRLGALLAGMAASRRAVHGYVAWAPVHRGRHYVRELRALDLVGTEEQSDDDGYVEAGGFRLGPSTADALKALDLTKNPPCAKAGAFVIDRSDQPSADPLARALEAHSVPVEWATQDDYLDMMAEPQFTVVPTSTLGRIGEWLKARSPFPDTPTRTESVEKLTSTRSATFATGEHAAGPGAVEVKEELLLVPRNGGRLFGVLCTPARAGMNRHVVLLPNSGSVHHVGPNRLYVELARALASEGMATFRFDLRNLGDSRVGDCPEENHPYPDTAVADVEAVAAWMVEAAGYESCVVAGLCSGAHTAFHAGHEIDGEVISEVVSINPLTFRYERGMSLTTPASYQSIRDQQNYSQAVRDPKRWLRLLRGQGNTRHLLRFLLKRPLEVSVSGVRLFARWTGLRPPGPLERDLLAINALKRPIHFVFSSTDPGLAILKRDARLVVSRLARRGELSISVVDGADHTFSRSRHRSAAIRAVIDGLGRTG